VSETDLFQQFMAEDRRRVTSPDPATAQGRINTRVAVAAQPNQQAEFGALAKRYGVPSAVVESDPDVWRQRAASDGAQQQINAAPKLGQWLGQDPQNAKVSHDSLEAMAGIEQLVNTGFNLMRGVTDSLPVARPVVWHANGTDAEKLRDWHLNNPGQGSLVAAPSATSVALSKVYHTLESAAAGANDIAGGFWGSIAAATKFVGDNPVSRFAQRGAEVNAQLAEQRSKPTGGTLEQGFYSAVRSTPLSIGSIIAGGPTQSVARALIPIGVQQFGQSFSHAQTEGLSYGRSLGFGAVDAAVETGTEALPLGHLFKAMKVGSPLTKRVTEFLIAQAEEQGGEQIATHVEDFNQWAQIDSNKGKSFSDYMAERPDAALQTAVATAFTSGIMGAAVTAHHAISTASATMARKEQQATVAQHTEALLTGLKEIADAAPLAQRDVSTFENWVRAAADGTKATDVYIDAQTLVQTLQQSGMSEPEIIAALPSLQTELPTALAANGDVRIPIEEFAARSGELGASLIPHLRLDPNDMSTAEAKSFMQGAQEEFQKETDKAFDTISADDAFRQSADRVKEQVAQQLDAAGRFTPDTNSAYASLYSSFFSRLAADLGETPEAVAARYPLQIQAEGVKAAPGVLDQKDDLYSRPNPTANEVERRVDSSSNNQLRGLFDTASGKTYWWDAAEKTHEQAAKDLGVEYWPKGKDNRLFATRDENGAVLIDHGGDISLPALERLSNHPDFEFNTFGGRFTADDFKTQMADYRLVGRFSPDNIQELLTHDDWAILTAANPKGKEHGEEFNTKAQAMLARDLDELGLSYTPTVGKYGQVEPGFAVVGITSEQAQELGRKYDQDSVLTAQGLIYQDGSINPATGVERFTETPEDFYTTIPELGTQFAVGINFDERIAPQSATTVSVLAQSPIELDTPPVDENGQIELQHWSHDDGLTMLDPSRWGRAGRFLPQEERSRKGRAPGRSYFGIATGQPGGYTNEFRNGDPIYRTPRFEYTAKINADRLYDMAGDPLDLKAQGRALPKDDRGRYIYKEQDIDGVSLYERLIQDAGYLGYWIKDPRIGLTAAVFTPTEVRRAENETVYAQALQPVFYSALQRTIENSKQTKAPASQWKAILQNAPGVKAEELEWSGVLDLLDADPKAVVTRDQLAELMANGGIQIEEVVLGAKPDQDVIDAEVNRRAEQMADDFEDEVGDGFSREDFISDNWGSIEREVEAEFRELRTPEFKDWSSDPSNDTYRELLLRLPIGRGRNPSEAPSTHWDERSVVAHARFMEKRDAEGKRVLFIEEVQSDWHQKGRDQGYAKRVDPDVADELGRKARAIRVEFIDARVKLAQAINSATSQDEANAGMPLRELTMLAAEVGTPEAVEAAKNARTLELQHREAQQAWDNALVPRGIPNAPFKTSWPALVMKRMIRYAAEHGFEKVAWTTGEEQADRYNLSESIGEIRIPVSETVDEGRLINLDAKVAGLVANGGYGTPLNDWKNARETVIMTPAQLREVFGQDLGTRLEAAQPGDVFAGDDLKVGGEGMKAFYDRNLVNITNDLIKKYGAKVGKFTVSTDAPTGRAFAEGRGTNAPAVDMAIRKGQAAVRHGFGITDKLAEAAAGGFPLFQRKGAARGQASFAADITQSPTVITLLRGADLSTFLHESGHFFLEVMMDVAKRPDAPQRVAEDVNAFLRWTGVESVEHWQSMTTPEKRDHHERFARGFEAYLYEGKAPSLELRSLFQRFRAWLVTVYRSLKELNVELTPEVRGVFDRMLASDAHIKEAEQQVGYEPILTSKPESMDDAEWEAYQRLGAEATAEATSDLERRSLRDMRYAGKAAGRELKRLQREIKAMRDTMRTEVEADLAVEPVYRAQTFMKKGLLDGVAVEGPTKMLLSEVEALYEDRPILYVNEVKRALGFGQYGMLAKEGIHPEQIAELFGFTSADHMIQDLMLAEPFSKAVETEIDTRMLERYGDITSEKALQDAVDGAIHNDVRGRFVASEYAALSKAPGKPRVLAAAAKQMAEGAVARVKVRNLRPAQYEAAERRAAKAAAEAARKGEIAQAAAEKRNQLVNFYGAKASRDALTEVDRIVRYLKKFDTAGTRANLDPGYLDQIDKLMERFDLRKSVTNRQADSRKSLSAWVKRQQEQGLDPIIDEDLLDEANRTPYRELTVEQIRGLRDAVKNIEHLARLKKKLLTAKDKREFADAVQDVATAIKDNAFKSVPEIIGSKSWWERVQAGTADFFAMHRKMANWAHVMDGNKTGGPVWERFIRPMNAAGDTEAGRRAQATKDLGALFDRLKGQNLNKRTFIPAIGKSLSLQDRLMVALNLGNEGNTQRVMDGERWEQDKLNAVLEPLTQEHWQFVQAIWDYLDSFYPEIAAKELRVTGVAPEKVAARPFDRQLNDGTVVQLRGGYFPIKYDTARSSKAEADTAAEVLKQMTQGQYTAAQTRRGHTKARAEQVDRPVRKDFGVIFEHVNQVIHDLSWHEYLIDANRLLRAVDIDSAIREAHGPQVLKWMRKALEDIAIGDIPTQNSFESVINHVRSGASIAALGWNLWTSLLQPIGLTQSASRIGTKWVAKGASRIIGDAAHLENTARWVYDRSEFMRLRSLTQQREIAEIRNKLSDKSPLRKTVELAVPAEVVDAVEGSYFTLIAKAQLIADLPTWIGQYEKSMASGETEERAADIADQAVLDSQGGGQTKDLAGIQRGSPLMKLWTNFYSYFNTTYNLMADRTAQLRRVGPSDLPAYAVDQLLLTAAPSILTTVLYQLIKGDGDDWDEIGSKIGADLFSYLTGLMVGLREIGAVLNPESSYQGPAGARVFSEINKFGKQVQQGEADEALARSTNQLAGILFHYPAGQVDRTARGIRAMANGDAGPMAPVVGPPPK